MHTLGGILESFLNLSAVNGGLLSLLRNYYRGEIVLRPKPDDESYASIVGNLDWRWELDKNIKPDDDEKYKVAVSIMAAKLSYENEAYVGKVVEKWEMELLLFDKFWNGYLEEKTTQAFMMQDTRNDTNLVVVAFRGTEPFNADAWRTDIDISWYELPNVGKVHRGFIKALALQENNSWPPEITEQVTDPNKFAYYEIRKKLKNIIDKNKKTKFIVTGHSLGGALAILFVAGLAIHNDDLLKRLEGVYTFGQPRVGDDQFGKFKENKLKEFKVEYRRYVYSFDIVPRIPDDGEILLFKHFGPCFYFNSWYKGEVLKQEPNKNYFSIKWWVPKFVNAVWELIRSFVMPCMRGSEYKEGWFMICLRVVGLVFPGISAHCPQDYVNLTLVGSLPDDQADHSKLD